MSFNGMYIRSNLGSIYIFFKLLSANHPSIPLFRWRVPVLARQLGVQGAVSMSWVGSITVHKYTHIHPIINYGEIWKLAYSTCLCAGTWKKIHQRLSTSPIIPIYSPAKAFTSFVIYAVQLPKDALYTLRQCQSQSPTSALLLYSFSRLHDLNVAGKR